MDNLRKELDISRPLRGTREEKKFAEGVDRPLTDDYVRRDGAQRGDGRQGGDRPREGGGGPAERDKLRDRNTSDMGDVHLSRKRQERERDRATGQVEGLHRRDRGEKDHVGRNVPMKREGRSGRERIGEDDRVELPGRDSADLGLGGGKGRKSDEMPEVEPQKESRGSGKAGRTAVGKGAPAEGAPITLRIIVGGHQSRAIPATPASEKATGGKGSQPPLKRRNRIIDDEDEEFTAPVALSAGAVAESSLLPAGVVETVQSDSRDPPQQRQLSKRKSHRVPRRSAPGAEEDAGVGVGVGVGDGGSTMNLPAGAGVGLVDSENTKVGAGEEAGGGGPAGLSLREGVHGKGGRSLLGRERRNRVKRKRWEEKVEGDEDLGGGVEEGEEEGGGEADADWNSEGEEAAEEEEEGKEEEEVRDRDAEEEEEKEVEIGSTKRRRALLGEEEAVLFPEGLVEKASKRKGREDTEEERVAKREETARKRKLQTEKAEKESQANAIQKILGQDSSRKRREEKAKQQRADAQEEKRAAEQEPAVNTVRSVDGPGGITILWSVDAQLPPFFEESTRRYPSKRAICEGPGCSNPYKYRDSHSRAALCSLKCYRAKHSSAGKSTAGR